MKKFLFGAIAIALFSFSGFANDVKSKNIAGSDNIIKAKISTQAFKSKKAIDDLCTRTITVNGDGYSYDVSVSGPCSQIDNIVEKAKKILSIS